MIRKCYKHPDFRLKHKKPQQNNVKDSDRIQPEWFSPNWDNLKANNDSKHVIQKNNTSNLRVYLLKCRKINVEEQSILPYHTFLGIMELENHKSINCIRYVSEMDVDKNIGKVMRSRILI